MIRHIVMWKFNPGTEAEQTRFLDGLRGLQGVIPEIVKLEVGTDLGSGTCDAVLVAEFRTMEDLHAYQEDPRHQAVSAICKAIRAERAVVDFEF